METRPSFPINETQEATQENALRAMFHHYALMSVDTAHAWERVSRRLPSLHTSSVQVKTHALAAVYTGKQLHGRRLRRLSPVAMVALVAVLLMGAGVAAATGWGSMLQEFLTSLSQPVSAHQFTHIEQQQESHRVTITVEDVYADSQRTIISMLIQLSPDMLKQDSFALPQTFSLTINGQKETLISQKATCVLNFNGQHSAYCVWVLTPVQVASNTKRLDVTWDITTIRVKKWRPLNAYQSFSGRWHFHFTLPFQQQAHDPGKPPTPVS